MGVRAIADPPTILEPYSRLKLGFHDAVEFYSYALATPVRKRVLRDAGAWIVTGPARATVPAAANLLASRVTALVAPAAPVREAPLRRAPDVGRFPRAHYGGLDLQARREAMRRSSTVWHPHPSYAGASVVYINDVNVTGTQESLVRTFLVESGVRRVHWQYILEIEGGRGAPQTVETMLNESTIRSPAELAGAARDAELTVTSKLLWRLFSWDDDAFDQVVGVFSRQTRGEILGLLRDEGLLGRPELAGRVAELAR